MKRKQGCQRHEKTNCRICKAALLERNWKHIRRAARPKPLALPPYPTRQELHAALLAGVSPDAVIAAINQNNELKTIEITEVN